MPAPHFRGFSFDLVVARGAPGRNMWCQEVGMFSDSTIDSTERSRRTLSPGGWTFAFWAVKGHHALISDLALR